MKSLHLIHILLPSIFFCPIIYYKLTQSTNILWIIICSLYQIFMYKCVYFFVQACCVEYIILESDNLSSMFPNARINLLGYVLDSHHLFALATTLAVLPTCWLRDLSLLSYISGKNVPHAIFLIRSYLIFINEIMCLKRR